MSLLIPRVSEKAYASAQDGTYVFNVAMSTNKASVIADLKEQFNVTATDVRFVIKKGKPVRAMRGKRQNPGIALRSKTKKAYIRLQEGDKLELFNESEEK